MVMPGTRRKAIPQPERTKVWVRSGGRCAICGRYLLEGALTHQEVTLGELAHIVGQQTTTGSPRGKHPLSPDKRDKAENLMLLCAGEHDEIDRAGSVDSLTVDRLRKIKSDHEDWVFRMTGLDRSRGTAVLRMIGSVRGNPVELSRASASDAVLRSDDRFPDFPLSYEQYGFEILLRHVAQEGTEGYWAAARAVIDETIEHKLKRGFAERRSSISASSGSPASRCSSTWAAGSTTPTGSPSTNTTARRVVGRGPPVRTLCSSALKRTPLARSAAAKPSLC